MLFETDLGEKKLALELNEPSMKERRRLNAIMRCLYRFDPEDMSAVKTDPDALFKLTEKTLELSGLEENEEFMALDLTTQSVVLQRIASDYIEGVSGKP